MSKFAEGQSGNPSGRPRGIKDKRVIFAEMLNDHKDNLFNKAIDLALGGNEHLLRLFLDRLLPAKPKDNPVELGFSGSAYDRVAKTMTSLNDGAISPMQANDILGCIEKEITTTKTEEFEQRIAALEEQTEKNQDE